MFPVSYLLFHCQGSDPPQKHAGAESPSPAAEKNSNDYETTFRDLTKCFSCYGVNTQTQVLFHKHTKTHTNCLRDEGRIAVQFFVFLWLTFHRSLQQNEQMNRIELNDCF